MNHTVYWIAGLSNGQTITEGKGDFQVIEGELSPWQRLLAFCAANGATITSMSLATADGRRFNLPSAGKNPKFKAFADAPKPLSYKAFRKFGADVTRNSQTNKDLFTVIEASYEGGSAIQVWVDEDTLTSWSLIV